MKQEDANQGTSLISDADATYLQGQLPPHTFGEMLAFLEQLPEDLRPTFITLIRREAEAMNENALLVAMSRLSAATNPAEDLP